MAIDGRELAASLIRQSEAAGDVKDLRRELARIQAALVVAEKNLAQATADRRRLLSEVSNVKA